LLSDGAAEVSAFTELNGVKCKARADYLIQSGSYAGTIIDLKKTRDASPDGFYRSVEKFRYDVQAAFYTAVFESTLSTVVDPTGWPINGGFIFIAVEDTSPNLVQCYELDIDCIDAGVRAYTDDLKTLQECRATGEWPGYSTAIELLEARHYGRMAPRDQLTMNGVKL